MIREDFSIVQSLTTICPRCPRIFAWIMGANPIRCMLRRSGVRHSVPHSRHTVSVADSGSRKAGWNHNKNGMGVGGTDGQMPSKKAAQKARRDTSRWLIGTRTRPEEKQRNALVVCGRRTWERYADGGRRWTSPDILTSWQMARQIWQAQGEGEKRKEGKELK